MYFLPDDLQLFIVEGRSVVSCGEEGSSGLVDAAREQN
jgi:hypothetical protein